MIDFHNGSSQSTLDYSNFCMISTIGQLHSFCISSNTVLISHYFGAAGVLYIHVSISPDGLISFVRMEVDSIVSGHLSMDVCPVMVALLLSSSLQAVYC